MNAERCQRCFGEVLNGKCSCGLHTTVETILFDARSLREKHGAISDEDLPYAYQLGVDLVYREPPQEYMQNLYQTLIDQEYMQNDKYKKAYVKAYERAKKIGEFDTTSLEQDYIDATQDPGQQEVAKIWDSTCGDGLEDEPWDNPYESPDPIRTLKATIKVKEQF